MTLAAIPHGGETGAGGSRCARPDLLTEAIRHALNDGECADWFVRAHADDLGQHSAGRLPDPHDAASGLIHFHNGSVLK